MKKNILFIIGIIMGLGIGFSTALAQGDSPGQQQDRVKVYLSEPIGAGIDVHLVTRCEKRQQTSNLLCNDQTKSLDPDCEKEEKKKGRGIGAAEVTIKKVLYSRPIEECVQTSDDSRVDFAHCTQEEDGYILRHKQGDVWVVALCPAGKRCPYDPEQPVDTTSDYFVKERIVMPTGQELNGNYEPHTGKPLYQKYAKEVQDGWRIEYLRQFTTSDCEPFEFTPAGVKLSQPKNVRLGCTIPPDVISECKNKNTSMLGTSREIGSCAFTCKKAERISGRSGTDLISRYIAVVYKGMAAIVGIIAVLNMVYRGIRISMGGSQAEEIEAAKKSIFMSIAGLALLFLSGIILYAINPNFFV